MNRFCEVFITNILFSVIFIARAFAQEKEKVQDMGEIKKIIDIIIEYSVKYSFQVLGGIIILIAGWIIAGIICKFFKRFLDKFKLDVTIVKFLVTALKMLMMAFAAIIAGLIVASL